MAASFKTLKIKCRLILLSTIIAFTDAATFLDVFSATLGSMLSKQVEAPFSVIQEWPVYVERKYNATTWVCANQTEVKKNTPRHQQETFVKLFSYMEDNDMAMTVPVSIEYHPENGNEPAQVSACFYLSVEDSETKDLPAPTDDTLFIVTKEPMNIFTRKIGGFLTGPRDWLEEAKDMNEIMALNGETVRSDLMFWNAFDSPLKFWDRRNEVWLVKKDSA